MTAYAPTWTGRLKVSYFGAGAVHTQTWRYPGPSSGSGVTDLITVIQDYYDALANKLWSDFAFNSVVVADIDSPIFLPIIMPFTPVTGAVSTEDFEPMDKAEMVSFVGRSTGGNPWRIGQFGLATKTMEISAQYNFRILAVESPEIAAAVAVLQAGGGTILGNDGNAVAVYEYADVKPNDRWVKKIRRGA